MWCLRNIYFLLSVLKTVVLNIFVKIIFQGFLIIIESSKEQHLFEMEIIYIYIRGGVNRTFSIIDRIYLVVIDKFEGRLSFWQIALS